MKKILFITHEASRTGAPFVIFYFMEWLQKHTDVVMDVFAIRDGDLRADFELIANRYETMPVAKYTKKTVLQRGIHKLFPEPIVDHKTVFFETLSSRDYDVVYSNTILSIPYGDRIKKINSRTKHIAHIHELSAIIKMLLPDIDTYTSEIDGFIAASNLVANTLIDRWAVPKDKVTRVYECSKIKTVGGIPKSNTVFTVGGAGTVHWRKGCDLFLQVAVYVKKNLPEITNINFVWVGSISAIEQIIFEEDIEKLGLAGIVNFVGQQEDPSSFFNDFDLFLMTSREDPFPLVCIEVGMLGKPIICFKGATGSEEIIEKGGGVIVPYIDVEAMGKQVIKYVQNPAIIKEHGAINKREFANFSPEIIAPQLWEVILTIK